MRKSAKPRPTSARSRASSSRAAKSLALLALLVPFLTSCAEYRLRCLSQGADPSALPSELANLDATSSLKLSEVFVQQRGRRLYRPTLPSANTELATVLEFCRSRLSE